jgi:peptidoglycan/xylan/chitin deacetylase (PgdA/CDA1 family)
MRRAVRTVGRRVLGRPSIIKRAPHGPPAVALTFDDGPSEWTGQIAAALEEHGCRGTFFMRGPAVEERPETVAALASAGHELGNHLWTHSDPTEQSRVALRSEIIATAKAILAAGAPKPALVRPPYCGAPQAVARAASHTGTGFIVLRSVDPADWKATSADDVFDGVMSTVSAGDIVCLHDGIPPGSRGTASRTATVSAVKRMIPALLDRGLPPVTVSMLLR